MTETNPCVECGNPKVEKYRKKCWACLNCWRAHEMSLVDWKAKQAEKEKGRSELRRGTCDPCGKNTKYPKPVGGMLMCEECNVAFGNYHSSKWRETMNKALAYEESNAPKTSHELLGKS